MGKNEKKNWSWPLIAIHWLVATAVFGLFALGWWMVDLSYYDPWYKTGPDLHKSIGFLLFMTMVARLVMRVFTRKPAPISSHAKWEKLLASKVHIALYLLVFLVMLSGYLISTADGRAISVFGIIDIPATITEIENQEDIAGLIHWYAACTIIALAVLHAAGALKHHLLDKDDTLKRMLGKA
ncbi:cytochrome b [Veronia nyctiphanis]|uniref:Cytochrome b n=1 Tax=Veronia nyctiphanis TaxID=1278244 RepID=A0A4Q0YYK2_9GAMM|nr:cytochrome b [Veronia nyctiphanis]RXJ74151.1 cytochrome b [Veronia nyctiphanis]